MKRERVYKKSKCIDCGKLISLYATRCKSCARKGKRNPAYKNGLKTRDENKRLYKYCIDCGVKIDPTAIRCKKCSGKFRVGKNNPLWKGGIDAEGYVRIEFNDRLKEQVRKRDAYTCQECGKIYEKKSKAFDVHHIDYNKKNNALNNLLTLCNRCHAKTSIKDKEFWYAHFVQKINNKNSWFKITWEDACSYTNESLDDMQSKKPELVDTFGKLILYDKKYCVIMTHDSRGDCNDYIKIPITLLRKIEKGVFK